MRRREVTTGWSTRLYTESYSAPRFIDALRLGLGQVKRILSGADESGWHLGERERGNSWDARNTKARDEPESRRTLRTTKSARPGSNKRGRSSLLQIVVSLRWRQRAELSIHASVCRVTSSKSVWRMMLGSPGGFSYPDLCASALERLLLQRCALRGVACAPSRT